MTARSGRWLQVGLVALAAIPVVAGTSRLVEILGGPELIPTDQRFAASPTPVVVHVAAAIGYILVGAFQFSARIRRRHPGWHRRAGRVLVVLGLAVAISALWMTLVLPRKEGTGDLLYVFRLLFGSGMAVSIILGVVAIRRRDIVRHRAWMTRAYALALGVGTQAFTVGFGGALFGSGLVRTDLMMGAGWGINLAVAEWFIRHSPPPGRRSAHSREQLTALDFEMAADLAGSGSQRSTRLDRQLMPTGASLLQSRRDNTILTVTPTVTLSAADVEFVDRA